MADERTEKQKVQEITDKLEKGLKELFESEMSIPGDSELPFRRHSTAVPF